MKKKADLSAAALSRLGAAMFAACLLANLMPRNAANENPLALPKIGDHSLLILSPTLLELTLVTTKEPNPAPVTTWNFVGANFVPQIPTPSEFAVTVNGSAVAVTETGFRRRPMYAPLKARDLRIGNSLFLKLASPIPADAVVTVRNNSGAIWDNGKMTFTARASERRFSPAIHVNQVGYVPAFSKKAMVGYYLGSLGEMPISAGAFHLRDAQSGAAVFTGTLTSRLDIGYTYSPAPYQKVLEADFSAFSTPGEYVLHVPGLGESFRFLIHEGVAASFARSIALGLYHQRCGAELGPPHTRHEHGVCHAAPAEVPTMEFTAVNHTLANETWNFTDFPRHTAPRLQNVDSSLYPFINKGPIDVRGGHHDAGDYSKYTINSAGLIHHLVFATDALPGVGALDNLGIPESGDGKSDLLQEAKWEADFLAKMQDADGGFYFLVYPRNRRYEDDVLPDAGDSQVVFPKTTAVTAAATAALAEIASSPTFRTQFPQEAALYLEKAHKGWQFLVNAIAKHGKDGSYQKITHYGNEFLHDDELAWAAAAMFAATGDPAFNAQLQAWFDPSSRETRRWTWWRLFEGYGCAVRIYAYAEKTGRLPAGSLTPGFLAACEAELIAAGEDIARFSRQTAYGASFPDPNKSFLTAGWFFASERAFELTSAYLLQPKAEYLDALISNVNYEGGCNPVNMPFITGLGWRRWRDIVHQHAQNDHQVLPPSGLPLGNVIGGFAYLHHYKEELGQLCFPPDGTLTAPYPFYDRFGDSFNTTAEFVVVDQARSLGTMAFLMAQTQTAATALHRPNATITGLPNSATAGQPVTAVFETTASLTGARIVWEAADQQPAEGATWTFTPTNPGEQWVEAEALLPDGTRIFARTSFTANVSYDLPPNPHQSAPVTLTPDIAALYHLDGTGADSGTLSPSLTLAGNAHFDSGNLGWMAARSGGALRFYDLGDKATVTLGSLYSSGETLEISLEAMVYVKSLKGWNRSLARLLTLERSWNASLKWVEDKYSGPHIGGGTQFDLFGASLAAAMPLTNWHHLRISIGASGYAAHVNGQLVASAASAELGNWSGVSAVLELGNFDGWIDEVVVRSRSALPAPLPTVPGPISELSGVAASPSSAVLTWSCPQSSQSGYRLSKSQDNVVFTECAALESSETTWTDNSLAPDTTYFYAVQAFNNIGVSPPTFVSVRTPLAPPPAPESVTATTQKKAILIEWNSAAGATAYTVKRSQSPAGPFTTLAANLQSTSYTDTALSHNTRYYYTVSASNTAGHSADSSVASALAVLKTPSAPPRFISTSQPDRINLRWFAVPSAEQYTVLRATSISGPYSVIASGITSTAFSDSTVAVGVRYFYLVFASNVMGSGPNSILLSARTFSQPPSKPARVTASVVSNGIAIRWTAGMNTESVTVKRSASPSGPFLPIRAGLTGSSFTDQNAPLGIPSYYTVTAVNTFGESAAAGFVSAIRAALP